MKKINKNMILVIIIIIFETLLLKVFMYDFLPTKYFLDAKHILGVIEGTAETDKSYTYVANIFNMINFFNISNIRQWGYIISSVFVPIIIFCILREKKYNTIQNIFIIASFALLNIYVLGLSKDIIQFVYFLLIFIILKQNWKVINKLIGCCFILLYEAFNFRIYYAIMAILIITIYFIYKVFINKSNDKKNTIKKIIIYSIIFFFVELFFLQLVSRDNYNSIINARSVVNVYRENSTDAETIIIDLLGANDSFFKFIGNYTLNFFRLICPIELLFKSLKYSPFVIYQLMITIIIIKSGKKIKTESDLLWLITIISYIMVSSIFEPDYGSFIRHETSIFLIILELTNIIKNNEKINYIDKEKESDLIEK